jgi:hypothetical protein
MGNLYIYRNGIGWLNAGGLAGFVDGEYGGKITLENCWVEGGNITLESKASNLFRVGGCVGCIYPNAVFTTVRSLAGVVTVKSDNTRNSTEGQLAFIGGFAGTVEGSTMNDCYSNTDIIDIEDFESITVGQGTLIGGFTSDLIFKGSTKLTGCYATGNVTVSISSGYSSWLTAGGLLGRANRSEGTTGTMEIERCYATGSVTVTITGTNTVSDYYYAGGLVGDVEYAVISQSYATGSVNVIKNTTNSNVVYAGGIIGYLLKSSEVENCYALGDVLADSSSGDNVYAGGLVGYINANSGNKLANSFAAGSVTAQSNSSSAEVYAGGIVGYKADGTLSSNAALGAKIAATGGNNSTRKAARIYASSGGTAPQKNYALNSMLTDTDATYDEYVPGSVVSSGTATSADGDGEGIGKFRTQDFWTGSSTLDFDPSLWSFTYLAGKGYPRLAGVGGQ